MATSSARPSLSVVIPVYNEAAVIDACLTALTTQTESADEILIVDNNSADDTVARAERYAGVRVLREERQGISYARQTGFDAVRNEIIARIDADTLVAPDWVASIRREFREHHVDALAGGAGVRELSPRGRFWGFWYYRLFRAWHERSIGVKPMMYGFNSALTSEAWKSIRSLVTVGAHQRSLEEHPEPRHRRRPGGERGCGCDDLTAEDRAPHPVRAEPQGDLPGDPLLERPEALPVLPHRLADARQTRLRQPQTEGGPAIMKSFRLWLSIITGAILVGLVVLVWPQIVEAFAHLNEVNLWILSLLLPVQLVSYFATGFVLFSYLKQRQTLVDLHPFDAARMSLEFNFVNHALPSGGVAGISYTSWKLSHYGVPAGNSTMGQLVRFVLTFASFIVLMGVALVWIIVSGDATPAVFLVSLGLFVLTLTVSLLFLWIASSSARVDAATTRVTRAVNALIRWVTFGRKRDVLAASSVKAFGDDLHQDYVAMSADRRVLIRPFLWSFLANIADASLFYLTFLALGIAVNPGVMFIAYGLSSIISIVVVTPGGAGVYEAVMIGFLASAGIPASAAIAGTLLARVILLLCTIAFGYVFYQLTILRYGKPPVREATPTGRLRVVGDGEDASGEPERA